MIILKGYFSVLLSEHQAALLQLKRECKEELEKLQVGVKAHAQDKRWMGKIHKILSTVKR